MPLFSTGPRHRARDEVYTDYTTTQRPERRGGWAFPRRNRERVAGGYRTYCA